MSLKCIYTFIGCWPNLFFPTSPYTCTLGKWKSTMLYPSFPLTSAVRGELALPYSYFQIGAIFNTVSDFIACKTHWDRYTMAILAKKTSVSCTTDVVCFRHFCVWLTKVHSLTCNIMCQKDLPNCWGNYWCKLNQQISSMTLDQCPKMHQTIIRHCDKFGAFLHCLVCLHKVLGDVHTDGPLNGKSDCTRKNRAIQR